MTGHLTREQHLKLAAGAARLLRDHGVDIADIADDIPKLIGIGHDMRALVEDVKAAGPAPAPAVVPATVTAAALPLAPAGTPVVPIASVAPQPHPAPRPPAATGGAMPAHQVAHEVAQDGLTPAERAAFERASRSTS